MLGTLLSRSGFSLTPDVGGVNDLDFRCSFGDDGGVPSYIGRGGPGAGAFFFGDLIYLCTFSGALTFSSDFGIGSDFLSGFNGVSFCGWLGG